jgi:E3 ubiquitin-protein ligase RAD18
MLATNLTKQPCPICKEWIASEIHLKKNTMLEEAVLAWQDVRYVNFCTRSKFIRADFYQYFRALVLDCTIKLHTNHHNGGNKGVKRKRSPSIVTPSGGLSRHAEASNSLQDETTLHECPICSKGLRYEDMGRHVDSNCSWMGTETKENKKKWANLLSGSNESPSKHKSKGKLKMSER